MVHFIPCNKSYDASNVATFQMTTFIACFVVVDHFSKMVHFIHWFDPYQDTTNKLVVNSVTSGMDWEIEGISN